MTQHHPSEHPEEPKGGYVIQSPYVGALLDIGARALQADREVSSLQREARLYGEDFHDFVCGEVIEGTHGWSLIQQLFDQDQNAWASIARASLLQVQMSEDQQDLERTLVQHAAIVTAWLTQVQGRTPVGAAGQR